MLFSDYTWYLVEGEEKRWRPRTVSIGMHLGSLRFGELHERLFTRSRFPFAKYRARRTLSDAIGHLAEVSASVHRDRHGRYLYSAATKLRMSRFAAIVGKMGEPAGLFDALYVDGLAEFMWINEGPWVFLFLAAERGMKREEILRWVHREPALKSQTRTWRMEKPVDAALVDAFFAAYAATFPRAPA